MDKKLISEELKRHRQLLEYTFYVSEEDKDEKDVNGDLLLDDMFITEQEPAGEEGEDPFADTTTDTTTDTDIEDAIEDTPESDVEDTTDTTSGLEDIMNEPTTETDPFGTDTEIEDEVGTDSPLSTDDETVEVDVTDIVDKTEETKTSVDLVGSKMDDLLKKLSDLESQVSGMDNVINKIDELEKEIEKRNPTPVERLEMRSMDSFPYSIKLTDFWKDKEGYETEEPEEEFILRQSDVDNFDEKEMKKSFGYGEE